MRQLVEKIRSIVAAGPVDQAAIHRLEACVKERIEALRTTSLCQGNLRPGRYLCYKDTDYGFVVMVLVWGPNDATAIHDHGTWGVEAVLKNSLLITQYSCCETNPEPVGSFVASEGMVIHNLPPDRDVHKVQYTSSGKCDGGPAVSLHIYGREMTGNRSFFPGEGFKSCKLETRELRAEFDFAGLCNAQAHALSR